MFVLEVVQAETASTGFVIGFVGMLRLHETAQKNTRSAAAFWNGVDLQIAVESVRISFLDFILPTQGVTTRQICL